MISSFSFVYIISYWWQGRISNSFMNYIIFRDFSLSLLNKSLTSSCQSIASTDSDHAATQSCYNRIWPGRTYDLENITLSTGIRSYLYWRWVRQWPSFILLFPPTLRNHSSASRSHSVLAIGCTNVKTKYWLFNHLNVRLTIQPSHRSIGLRLWSLCIYRWDFRSAQLRKRNTCFVETAHCFLGFQIQSGRRPSLYGRLCQISRGLQWKIQSRRKYGRSLGRKWFREFFANAIRLHGNLAGEVGWSGWNRQTPSCLWEHKPSIGTVDSWVFLPMSEEAIGQYINSAPRSGNEVLADAVVICSGLHVTPAVPNIEGINHLVPQDSPVLSSLVSTPPGETGIVAKEGVRVIHSSQYKRQAEFEGRHVLILGIGETGVSSCRGMIWMITDTAPIQMDLSHQAITGGAKSVTVCHRGGFLSFPKVRFVRFSQILSLTCSSRWMMLSGLKRLQSLWSQIRWRISNRWTYNKSWAILQSNSTKIS